MKRVALDSTPYGSYGDAKAKSRLQSLMQDYQELHKEVESSKNKLENMKQRKRTLRAEVRFLRRRYKYLMKRRSMTQEQRKEFVQEQRKEFVQQHNIDDKWKKIVNVQISNKNESALRDLPPLVPKPSNKTRVYSGNERNAPSHFTPLITSNLNPKGSLYKRKEAISRQNHITTIDLNKQECTYNRNSLPAIHTPASVLDSTHSGATFNAKQPTEQSRAPVFDLNQRFEEEEEYQDNCEMARQDKLSDLKLSLCRNAGEGPSRVVKRKISWQDPVALRV